MEVSFTPVFVVLAVAAALAAIVAYEKRRWPLVILSLLITVSMLGCAANDIGATIEIVGH